MGYRKRRRWDRFLLVGGAAVLGVVALIGAAAGDTERIGAYWATAAVDESGQARTTEVIDYDFGSNVRRGIFRDIPQLDPEAPIQVFSPTAPDPFVVEQFGSETRIRIGDPDVEISGRHRYQIAYPISVATPGGRISWNGVGAEWPVGMSNIDLHLAAANELTGLQCSVGEAGSWDPCTVTQPEPGLLSVAMDGLGSSEGITISAIRGPALTAPPALPSPPVGAAEDPGAGLLLPVATGATAALLAGMVASALVRRAGREYVWAGGSADAAFGPQFGQQYPTRLVDHDELDRLASTEFAPPKGIAAWQGGILHREQVSEDHQVAWLLERAIAGEVELQGTDDDLTMRLHPVDSTEHQALNGLFGGRDVIDLGRYDEQFASGWESLNERLTGWYTDSQYWDPKGEQRRKRTVGASIPLILLGAIALVLFSVMANRTGPASLVGVGVSAAVAGAGFAMALRSWELRVRTPEGSGLWILIESFRRFIHKSDAQHVDAAAKQGVLLDYTAWAVALGEVARWTEAIDQAERAGTTISPNVLYMTHTAGNLRTATSLAATAPAKSSGGGGGGFGGVGGGGGGGGGGSW